jgi:ABC-type multidrug transport system fused ATPase/permease subunit
MKTLKKLLFLLNIYERKKAVVLIILILIMALLDMISVASILPFMVALVNPDLINTNIFLNYIFKSLRILGVENNQQFIFALGILMYTLLIFSLAYKAFVTYAQVRFVEMFQYTVSKSLIEKYLYQPYSWFLNRHSADLGKNILSEVGQVTSGAIRPLIEFVAKSTVAIFLVVLIFIVDLELAMIVCVFLGGFYGIFFYFVRKHLNHIGVQSVKNNEQRFITVNEAFGAAKEVKIGGLEKVYIKLFSNSAKIFAQVHSSSQALSQLPRFILEAIAFGGLLIIMFYITSKTGNFNKAIPTVSLYVFAGYRLIPVLQQIYASLASLTFAGPSVDKLTEELKNLKPFISKQNLDVLPFNKTINLKNIYFEYPNSSRTALKNINLSISSKSLIGIVGPTGSGKTTTVDIILGLLEPQKGTLEIDGKIITQKNSRSWQRSIGYVPQQIFLSDDTVASNIAFGLESKDINLEIVEKVAKVANLHNFVVEELSEKYQTKIGERGIRLSGGQRQRIGIARALYHNPKVLVLDEATSALDNLTEQAVMDAINNLAKNLTIILIAHRLSTVKKCDRIFLLENGKIKNQGTFAELLDMDDDFRKSAKINNLL